MRIPFSSKPPVNVWIPLLVGIGGALIGAAVVALLTPTTGTQLRSYVKDFFEHRGHIDEMESDQSQIDRMSGEGGVNSSSRLDREA